MKYGRYNFRRTNTSTFRLICIILILTVAFLLTDAKLRPAIYDIAAIEAKSVAEKKVNTAVEKTLLKSGIDYSDIVTVNYSADNQITGITTDIVKMNLFKSEIAKAVDKAFENSDFVGRKRAVQSSSVIIGKKDIAVCFHGDA